jgi:hypothetical protein
MEELAIIRAAAFGSESHHQFHCRLKVRLGLEGIEAARADALLELYEDVLTHPLTALDSTERVYVGIYLHHVMGKSMAAAYGLQIKDS